MREAAKMRGNPRYGELDIGAPNRCQAAVRINGLPRRMRIVFS